MFDLFQIYNSKEGGKITQTIQPLTKGKTLTKLALLSKICYLQHQVQRQNDFKNTSCKSKF